MLENKKDEEVKNLKKAKSLKKLTNENLFPPLKVESNRVKINVLIHNKYIFPKIGILGNESKPYYVGHTKPVTKIVFINQNILCSISQESLCIKMWDLNNFNAMCLKNIDVNFIIADLLLAKGNNIVVCGEKLIILDVETEEKIIIFQTSFGNYIEFNLLAKINDNLAAASSLGGYFLIFDLITGEKIKRIEMNKIHFICDSENKKKQIKNETPKKSENNNENNNIFNDDEGVINEGRKSYKTESRDYNNNYNNIGKNTENEEFKSSGKKYNFSRYPGSSSYFKSSEFNDNNE